MSLLMMTKQMPDRPAFVAGLKMKWCYGTVVLVIGMWTLSAAMADSLKKARDFDAYNRLVLCLPTAVDKLDPTNYRSRLTQIVLKKIFDSLTTRNNSNTVIPQLAESWRLINDTLWQFKLRKDVLFHNGQPMTAEDVKFTLDRVVRQGAMDGRTSPRRSLFKPISAVLVQDRYTVLIRTHHPWPNLPLMLSLQEIVPAHHFQTVGSALFETAPVGTGPFRFIRSVQGKEILLERFDGYYNTPSIQRLDTKEPLNTLIIKVVTSPIEQIAMLKTGQCDIIFNLPPETIPILKMTPDLQIFTVAATRSCFAELNCTRPPLNDRRVRQALNYAVDMDSIVAHKLLGSGKTLSTVLLPNAFGYDEHLSPYPYDPTTALKLLDDAKYSKDHPINVYANNESLVLADGIMLYLTKLGLKARMVVTNAYRPQIIGPDAPWDIFVGSWGNTTLDPMGILPPKFQSRASTNFSGFSSTELDQMLAQAQMTMKDTLRAKIYHQIQSIIFNEAPMIFGYAPNEHYAVSMRVKNFVPSVTGMIELNNVYIDDKGRWEE